MFRPLLATEDQPGPPTPHRERPHVPVTARRWRRLGVALSAAALTLAGCGSTPPTSAITPGSTVSPIGPSATPTYSSLEINIIIDTQTVSPLDQQIEVDQGRPVVLVTTSDHDTTLILKGPQLDKTVAIGRKTTITNSFVALELGTITVSTDDPAATIARLTVVAPVAVTPRVGQLCDSGLT